MFVWLVPFWQMSWHKISMALLEKNPTLLAGVLEDEMRKAPRGGSIDVTAIFQIVMGCSFDKLLSTISSFIIRHTFMLA